MFGVTRQAYYKRKRAIDYKRSQAGCVVELVQAVRNSMPRLGVRKLYYMLEKELVKLGVGRDKLFSILRANHLLIKPLRSYHITTDSNHWYKKHKNLILETDITRPEQVWVSDITYIKGVEHSYLALITDAYSKKIMGYDLSGSLKLEGTTRALSMAVENRKYPQKELIHHSDRGLQYCSYPYQDMLKQAKIKTSMTENGDPYQNAIAERVNGILKQEFLLENYKVSTDILEQIIKESIDIYNSQRPHFSCELLTPNQMHKQDKILKPKYRKKISLKATLETNKNKCMFV